MLFSRARITAFAVVSGIGAALACSDSAQPLGTGDKVIDDTAGQDVYSPPPPQQSSEGGDGPYEASDAYGPALNTCASCTCDPTKNYCFSGGTTSAYDGGVKTEGGVKMVMPFPGGPVFGQPDTGADSGPPPPPCPLLPAGSLGNGCTPLPAACAASPTCDCLLTALQPSYKCYLVCSPSPGFLEVYCPGP